MSYPKPWVVNNVIVNDGIDWHAARWGSVLRGWQGLPAARALMFERYGTWPAIAGVRRPGRTISLETHLLHLLEVDRKLARTVYLHALSYEEETPYRLLCTDFIPPNCAPSDALLALGPWDVQTNGVGNWWVKDLIDTNRVPPFVGAVHFVDGRGTDTKAAVFEAAGLNYCFNGAMRDANANGQADLWTMVENCVGVPTESVIAHPTSTMGWLQRVQYTGVAGDAAQSAYHYHRTAAASFAAGEDACLSCDIAGVVSGVMVEIVIVAENAADGYLSLESTEVTLTTSLQRAYVVYPTLPATTDHIRVQVQCVLIDDGDSLDVQFGAVSVEKAAFPTTFCSGQLGPGYAWTGAAYGSTSTRTAAYVDLDAYCGLFEGTMALAVRLVFQVPYDYDADWPSATTSLFDVGGPGNNDYFIVYYDVTHQFRVWVNGGYRLNSPAQTFSAGDWIELIYTDDFSEDRRELYINGILAASDTAIVSPIVTAATWRIGASSGGGGQGGYAFEQVQVFKKRFTATEVTRHHLECLKARWLNVLCDQTAPFAVGSKETTLGFIANLVVDDDVRFHSRDGDAYFMSIHDTPWSWTIHVDTEDDVHPVLYVTPEVAKASGFLYRCWVPIVWKFEALTDYPVKLGTLDAAALFGAGKMQVDCDDLRVYDGTGEIDRWIKDPNTASTDVWVVLDFSGAQAVTLKDAMLIGDTVTSVQTNEDIGGFPAIGRFLIDSEAFTYRSKDGANRTFQNVVRAAKGTAAAGHAANADVLWIEHDIWIYYGDATLTAPTVDADNEPVFELDTSSNDSWDYDLFGQAARLNRPGTWQRQPITYDPASPYGNFYTTNHITWGEPWEEIGHLARRYDYNDLYRSGRWYLHHPMGILSMNFQNGERYRSGSWGSAYIQSSLDGAVWVNEFFINQTADPDTTWVAWSQNETLNVGSKYGGIFNNYSSDGTYSAVEVDDITVALDTTYTPDATIGPELNTYALNCTITNVTLGLAINLAVSVELGSTIEVDTQNKKVTDLTEGENLLGALTLIGGVRRQWLPLRNGDNVLTYAETGVVEVSLDMVWDRRYIE